LLVLQGLMPKLITVALHGISAPLRVKSIAAGMDCGNRAGERRLGVDP
jgi:hypothetical protein